MAAARSVPLIWLLSKLLYTPNALQFLHFLNSFIFPSPRVFTVSVRRSVFLPSPMILLLFPSLPSFCTVSIRWRSASPPSKEKVIRQVDVGVGHCYQTFEWRSVPMGDTAEQPPSPSQSGRQENIQFLVLLNPRPHSFVPLHSSISSNIVYFTSAVNSTMLRPSV